MDAGAARVRVADMGGEEFKEAEGSLLATYRDGCGNASGKNGRELVQEHTPRVVAGTDSKPAAIDA